MSREAHRRGDEEALSAIYDFAQWCAQQRGKELWNAVGVAFYAHLFDEPELWNPVASRLTSELIREHWPLWEWRLGPEQLKKLRALLGERMP